MSARRRDPRERTRVSVICSTTQKEIVTAAAESARTDASTWLLAHGLRAANAPTGAGAPLVLSGQVADRLRALCDRQSITPDRAIEQLLVAEGGAP